MASTSALASTLLQCCSRPRASASALSVVVVQTASKSTQSKKSRKRPERPPGPARTPPGTNAKPAPAGRPKRYLTRYGIPPLHPSLTTNDPSKRIDRRAVEKAQRPDFEKIWRLESELAVEQDQAKVKKLREQIAAVRAAQPRRHPLWAFFREKTQADHEDEQEYLSAEQKAEGSSRPGEFSLAVSIQKPVAKIGNSGKQQSSLLFLYLYHILTRTNRPQLARRGAPSEIFRRPPHAMVQACSRAQCALHAARRGKTQWSRWRSVLVHSGILASGASAFQPWLSVSRLTLCSPSGCQIDGKNQVCVAGEA